MIRKNINNMNFPHLLDLLPFSLSIDIRQQLNSLVGQSGSMQHVPIYMFTKFANLYQLMSHIDSYFTLLQLTGLYMYGLTHKG